MFFTNAIRSRVVSLLQPWLRQGADVELDLGLLHSNLSVKDLVFDVEAIDQLLEGSQVLCLKHVKVRSLNIRISPWSVPAFTAEVSGVDVGLGVREPRHRCPLPRPGDVDGTNDRKMKDLLALIDPEGSQLHGAIEKLLAAPPRSRSISMTNVILRLCQLQFHQVNLQIQLPESVTTLSCFLKLKTLSAGCSLADPSCLLRGFIETIFVPQEESFMVVKGTDFEFGWEKENNVNLIVSGKDLVASVKLWNLQLTECDVKAPQVDFTVPLCELSVLTQTINILSCRQVMCGRSGRELWRIARRKISYLTHGPWSSWCYLLKVVLLWVRYIQAYESLLLFVGYCIKGKFELTQDGRSSSTCKHQLSVVSKLERELPVEAVARARRISRYKAALHQSESAKDSQITGCWRILLFFLFLWKGVCYIVHLIKEILLLPIRQIQIWCCKADQPTDFSFLNFKGCPPKSTFRLNLNAISINFDLTNSHRYSVSRKLAPDVRFPHLDSVSFSVVLKALCLSYVEDFTSQTFSVACGDVKICCSSLSKGPILRNRSAVEMVQLFKGLGSGFDGYSKTFCWTEPAPHFDIPEKDIDVAAFTNDACAILLKYYLGEMWLGWRNNAMYFDGNETHYLEHPFLLCEMRTFIVDPYIHVPEHGLSVCYLTLGRLNVDLDYMSLVSVLRLLSQILDTCRCNLNNKLKKGLSDTSVTNEEAAEWDGTDDHLVERTKMALLRLIPERNIHVGLAIAGSTIRVSLLGGLPGRKEISFNHVTAQQLGNYSFKVEVSKIEAAVWPASKSILGALTGNKMFDKVASEYLLVGEPPVIDMPKVDLHDTFSSKGIIALDADVRIDGINVSCEDMEERQAFQVIGPISATFKASTKREYFHSFQSMNTLSVTLIGNIERATFLLYMDELLAFFLVLESVLLNIGDGNYDHDSDGEDLVDELVHNDMAKPAKEACILPRWILRNTKFAVNATLDLRSMDIIMVKSLKVCTMANSRIDGASASTSEKFIINDDKFECSMHELPNYGVGYLQKPLSVMISYQDKSLAAFVNMLGLDVVIFRNQNATTKCSHVSELEDLLHCPVNCLSEFCVSNFSFSVSAALYGNALSPGANYARFSNDSLEIISEGCSQNLRQGQSILDTSEPPDGHWIQINLGLSETSLAGPSIKRDLMGAQQLNKLLLSLSIGRQFHKVQGDIQGGSVILEATALCTLVQCFTAYLQGVTNLCSLTSFEQPTTSVETHAIHDVALTNKQKFPEFLHLKISNLDLVIAKADGPGGLSGLSLQFDFLLNLESMNSKSKFICDISRVTIRSQFISLRNCPDQAARDYRTPHFSSISNDLTGSLVSENVLADMNEVSTTNNVDPQRYILKHGLFAIMAEKMEPGSEVGCFFLDNVWSGGGSLSGFDISITLSEIQMILELIAALSEVSSYKTSQDLKLGQKQRSTDQPQDGDARNIIQDGAVVAIKDLQQHMYFAVEAVESKYHLVGVVHYSLVGERALFQVRYHNQRRWRSRALWFSLVSLYAKNDKGEPLRLNFSPGSAFVDISSTDDKAWACWLASSFRPTGYMGDEKAVFDYRSSTRVFSLVNQKSNYAVAFVDGVPEFVRKPGNPFKMKVFDEFPLSEEVIRKYVPKTGTGETFKTNISENSSEKEEVSMVSRNFPYMVITFDKVTLTVHDEVSVTDEAFPLLQGCISNFESKLQVSSSKIRYISTFTISLHYFDARRGFWREIVSPVEACVFYRHKFVLQHSNDARSRPLASFFFRIKQVDISLPELSLDILLFIVGKLDLAGPYAVKSSNIFANGCKVENHSGITLLCSVNDMKDFIVAGRHSASVFLRHALLANQPQEKASLLSFQLSEHGSFSTSPIQVSLMNAQVFAWRTRVISLKDSRTFPGPVVVVDISGKEEEGVSVVVSPMVRIHNHSGFPMEVRICRPQETKAESASAFLENGDTIDDSMAVFDALGLSGGSKKAIMSLSLGNFLLSFRPELPECSAESERPVSVDWSEDLKGGKAIHVSGIFDKLNFRLKRAFGMAKFKSSFSTTHCSISIEDHTVSKLHFLIQTLSRDVPLKHPRIFGDSSDKTLKPEALQEQKEIFLLPTVQITNLLQTDILAVLTETHPGSFSDSAKGLDLIGKKAEITCGSSAYLYANPTLMYFTVTLKELNSSCRPVHIGDCVKKLNKQKSDVRHLDVELDFSGGKYSAFLRLSRGDRGILEAVVYTSYMLQNQTDLPLLCFASKQKLLSWSEVEKYGSNIPPEFGSLLPSNSIKSWFHKSSRVYLKWMEEKASQTFVDLDILSGFTELGLEMQREAGVMQIAKLGVSVKSYSPGIVLPSQIVSMVPRYIIFNETADDIMFRQSCFEGDADAATAIRSHQGAALQMRLHADKRREISFLDSVLKKHRIIGEESLIFIRFGLKESGWSWSGPVCVTSLGRFYIKFKKQPTSAGGQSNVEIASEDKLVRYAAVHTAEEGSSIVLRFNMPPNMILPYRIENSLSEMSVVYYQKDSIDTEILRPGTSTEYVWDDLCLPHKLVVQLSDTHLSREINIDKMCPWKPFFKLRHTMGLAVNLPFEKKSRARRRTDETQEVEMLKVWYQVYADGLTRVLQICGSPDNDMEVSEVQLTTKVQIRVPSLSIYLLEEEKLDVEGPEEMVYSPLIAARFGNVNVDSIFTGRNKFNQIKVQSLIVDEKWQGAPFAAMIRRHQLDYDDMNEHILHIVFNLDSTKSKVKQVTYASIVLQPINLNVDEETLMRLVAFWRTSLADSSGPSTQFYFKHFEIHPIKIVASFLPGNPNSSYSSAQETLRTLLHSVVKIPTIKNKVVELNGVLLTHVLVTARELLIKCAQHYSWYSMRAIYILKGSTLLPPAFASIFDDTASSSLDIFFDPSSGLVSLPGLTLGMFKFISKCIDTKGFSGTKRYFGDLGKTMRTAGSNVLFAAITEISDSVLRGAETSGLNGMVHGFHHGILKLAMEPSLLGTAVMEGGPDRKIKLDYSPGADELYIEGYLQAMLDTIYKQDYLRVRVIDDQVILKNLPPNSSVIDEIMEHVKSFLVSKNMLKGEANTNAIRPLRHLRGETEWKIGPTLITLCEHLFVSFAIRFLRKQAGALVGRIEWKKKRKNEGTTDDMVPASSGRWKFRKNWGISKFILSGVVAYLDGRLCRHIPNALARRIVSGFLLSFLEKDDGE